MKFKQIVNKMLVTVALAALTAGAALAQKPNKQNKPAFEPRKESKQVLQSKSLVAKAGDAAITPANVDSFEHGYDFVRAAYFSGAIEEMEENGMAIVELAYLIDALEGQPEAAQLQKVLKQVLRYEGTQDERFQAVEQAANSYVARQKGEAAWYFKTGYAMTRLSLALYLGDNADVQKQLQAVKTLSETAPNTVSTEVLNPMKTLAKYAPKGIYTNDEMVAMDDTVNGILETVLA